MKKYIAIGHWGNKESTTSVADMANTKQEFAENLRFNDFVALVILTEKTFEEVKNLGEMELFDRMKKLTSNYRKLDLICDYVDQCKDIMEQKLANCEY